MAQQLPEVAIGTIDGVNQDFETSQDFLAGTLRVFVDGFVVYSSDDDGFEETGSRNFRMKFAPLEGTRLQTMYHIP